MPDEAAGEFPVVLHPLHPPGVPEALAAVPRVRLIRPSEETRLRRELEEAPILVTYVWDDEFLTSALRWIQSISAGVEQFPVQRLAAAGVVLTSARGVNAPTVAEHAFALLLSLTRGVAASVRRAGTWRPFVGEEIGGRTMVVLGLGAVGEEVARRALAWGMRVIGVKRHPDAYSGSVETVVGPDRLLDVFAEADVVVSALPDTPDTRGIIGTEALEALGRGWVINVGRGAAVDADAVLAALEQRRLQGVGLDVTDPEPLPADHPLWSHPRVVVTPHVGGLSPRYGERLASLFASNLAAFAGRGPWTNRVPPT